MKIWDISNRLICDDGNRFTLIFNNYCISSNNSRGGGGNYFYFHTKKKAIIRGKVIIIQGRRLFQIFLTGGHALNILFYYTKQ